MENSTAFEQYQMTGIEFSELHLVAQRKRMYYNDVTKYKQKKMKNSCVFARGF